VTYCAGWKYTDTVFLLADAAATKSEKPTTKHSSFGELHAEIRGEYVEESLLKLVPIGPGIVAAYAGDVQLATQYLDFLRDSRPLVKDNIELLKSLTVSMGPFAPDREVALLLASSAPDGSCELLRWSTIEGIDQSNSDFYTIGSLNSYHAALTSALLSQLIAGKLDPGRMLATVTAIVQSYGIHDNLIDMNVGGVIFGVQTRLAAVTWQQDTNYVIYSQNNRTFAAPAIVTVIARDNALIVSSSLTNDTRVFGHSTSTPSKDLWDEKWRNNAKAALDSGSGRYWVFINTSGKVITLICRQHANTDSRYVKLSNLGDGKFDLAISHELMNLLLQPLSNPNDGSMPFRLNVRND
jgi:hypothetical protein